MKPMLQSKRYTVRAMLANMEDNLASLATSPFFPPPTVTKFSVSYSEQIWRGLYHSIRNAMIYHDKQHKQ